MVEDLTSEFLQEETPFTGICEISCDFLSLLNELPGDLRLPFVEELTGVEVVLLRYLEVLLLRHSDLLAILILHPFLN